jgi:two-component system chemotaxis response regulator CheB
MTGHNRHILMIGTSAGGLDALDRLIGQLPKGLPAAIFIVQHMASGNTGEALTSRLGLHRNFRCRLARDGERFESGRIYIAPPDHHLLVKKRTLAVIRGARENRYRPAIDPLFRSAAVAHGTQVIGVVLTGMLDDGTAGLAAIKECGGITVVQDPRDAEYPDMPENAVANVKIDHCVPLSEMGALLEKLTQEGSGKAKATPRGVAAEAKIAERVLTDIGPVDHLGDRSPYSCPACGGPLWEVGEHEPLRFRCHTGHSFTAATLLGGQSDKVEESLWVTLRMLEERRHLSLRMARDDTGRWGKGYYTDRAKETAVHIKHLREMLFAPTAP